MWFNLLKREGQITPLIRKGVRVGDYDRYQQTKIALPVNERLCRLHHDTEDLLEVR